MQNYCYIHFRWGLHHPNRTHLWASEWSRRPAAIYRSVTMSPDARELDDFLLAFFPVGFLSAFPPCAQWREDSGIIDPCLSAFKIQIALCCRHIHCFRYPAPRFCFQTSRCHRPGDPNPRTAENNSKRCANEHFCKTWTAAGKCECSGSLMPIPLSFVAENVWKGAKRFGSNAFFFCCEGKYSCQRRMLYIIDDVEQQWCSRLLSICCKSFMPGIF